MNELRYGNHMQVMNHPWHLVSGVDCVVHVTFIMHVTLYNMQWHIALHMYEDIA